MKKIMVFITVLFLSSCGAPAFEIVSNKADKFTSADAVEVVTGDNNRLSTKSSQGGIHIDNKGVYLDPYAAIGGAENSIIEIGFYVFHLNHELYDGFRPIRTIIFINEKDERVELDVAMKDYDLKLGSWNTITKEYNSSFMEAGTAKVSIEDMKMIANSEWIEAKIIGAELIQTYDKEDIDNMFIKNIMAFCKHIGL